VSVCNGRLTLETGVALSVSDQSAKATLYFTPYKGNLIGLYDGSAGWNIFTFSEISITLAGLTANKNYDVWVYDDGGTMKLEVLVWTNDTTRATALAIQDGIYVKTGATTRRYVGTIRINATGGQCEDTDIQRFVWNFYNQLEKRLFCQEGSAHVYNGADRKWNNSDTNNKLEFISGMPRYSKCRIQAWLTSSSDGNLVIVKPYLNGADTGIGIINDLSFAFSAGDTGDILSIEGYNLVQTYEYSNSASSSFIFMRLRCNGEF